MEINKLMEKYGEYIELKSVSLVKDENIIRVNLVAKTLLPYALIGEIKREFSCLLDDVKIEVIIDFSAPIEQAKQDGTFIEYIKNMWAVLSPVLKHAISCGAYELDDNGDITVKMSKKQAGLSLGGDGTASINKFLKNELNQKISLKIAVDENIVDVAFNPEMIEAQMPKFYKDVPKEKKSSKNAESAPKPYKEVLYGKELKRLNISRMNEIDEQAETVAVKGSVIEVETKVRRDGNYIVLVQVSDKTNTLLTKIFLDKGKEDLIKRLEKMKKSGELLLVRGKYDFDNYMRDYCIMPDALMAADQEKREDKGEEGKKRVELHLHTQMSTMDALVNVKDAVSTAARWGHRALAITDHGVVQAFPAAFKATKDLGIKVIFGVEGYLLPDSKIISQEGDFTFIDIASDSEGSREFIYAICAKKVCTDGREEICDIFIDPGAPMSEALKKQTGYDGVNSDAVTLKEGITKLFEFVKGTVPVVFDTELMKKLTDIAKKFNLAPETECVSVGMLSHYLNRLVKDVTLENMCDAFGVELKMLSARDKVNSLQKLSNSLVLKMREKGINTLPLTDCVPKEKVKGQRSNYHIILLAKNHEGLLNLYRLVSYSHLEHFKKMPQIPRSLLMMHREGLIVGSACESGELFRAILANKSENEIMDIADFYDYMEIQPIGNNEFLVRNGMVKDDEGLRDLNRKVADIAKKQDKMLVATGDVHFLDPEDAVYRKILMHARNFEDAEEQAPLYFKTTDEMLEEFSYLGEEEAFEAVVKNPNLIADMCEKMPPFLSEKGTYAPTIEGAEEELSGRAIKRAHEIYGEVLPDVVQKRLDKELNSIIGNGYGSLYLMAQRLVHKSLSDGYLVGSRGSVGSSFVAHMAGITEVNALQPHYVCPNCKYSDFDVDRTKYACGVDMPKKDCPKCGTELKRDGYEIPFEVFLGFKGDKTPDIDLNFSGEYQPVAHKFTEEMFGEGYAFRAGTISGIKDKTVFGYVKAYAEDNGINMSKAEMNRLVQGCLGVKRTTGQHPGGIVIVPKENDIMEFTPIQHPADKTDASTITTHFDFHALDDRLVKLDILGHDDPTALRMLQDITGFDPKTVPQDDPDTMKLFSSTESLGITLEEINCDVGSLAIPEFGTNFVRQMLCDTRPTKMEELIRISGLSHGTDVWVGNAQDLVMSGTATLSDVICTRDDIMNYLMLHGCEPSMSFKIMENVRKGRGLTSEMEEAMKAQDIPKWFVDSCKKIQYMFPRAHAAAYVMMAFRIAYFKVHFPKEFYSVYFTVRADAFDVEKALGGTQRVLLNIKEIERKGFNAEEKEKNLLPILEVVFEMNKRGIELLPIDIYKSSANKFLIEDGAIRPPFSSIAGVGENAAILLEQGAKMGGEYVSLEDFRKRTKANSAVEKALKDLGCLEGIPVSNQISLF
ncbi:MAG: PolC-type DNA polymerase III [Clostridia bacterium]|nr:PolC-type DNA polymerase III [Clostridia bacterium]